MSLSGPLPLSQTPSQQAAMLDNDQEGVTGSNQWAPYSLGRRDVPPDNLMKKVRAVFFCNILITEPLNGHRWKKLKIKKNKCWGKNVTE